MAEMSMSAHVLFLSTLALALTAAGFWGAGGAVVADAASTAATNRGIDSSSSSPPSPSPAPSSSEEEDRDDDGEEEDDDDDGGAVHIVYPTPTMCNCYVIFDAAENVMEESASFSECISELGLPAFGQDDQPSTLSEDPDEALAQLSCSNVVVDHPSASGNGTASSTAVISRECFLRANAVHERWRGARRYWRKLEDAQADAFFRCYGRKMGWLVADGGAIDRGGFRRQAEAARGYVDDDFLNGILKAIDSGCDAGNGKETETDVAKKLGKFLGCAFASCHPGKDSKGNRNE